MSWCSDISSTKQLHVLPVAVTWPALHWYCHPGPHLMGVTGRATRHGTHMCWDRAGPPLAATASKIHGGKTSSQSCCADATLLLLGTRCHMRAREHSLDTQATVACAGLDCPLLLGAAPQPTALHPECCKLYAPEAARLVAAAALNCDLGSSSDQQQWCEVVLSR
jgi:hypothetical protein